MHLNIGTILSVMIAASFATHAYCLDPRLTLLPPDPQVNGEFGSSVASLGDEILVGAPVNEAAYLFDRSNGSLLLTVPNPAPLGATLFGASVAAFGDDFVVSGIPNTFTGKKGAAYLYSKAGDLIRSFASPNNSTADGFGDRVATIDDIVAVSAILDDSQATNSGAVYLFDGNSGQLLRTIINPHPKAEDRFGVSFATLGSNLVIGSTGGTNGAGAAYVFDPANGNLIREFDNPTPATNDYFGSAVATIGNDVLIGAHGDDTTGAEVGSVYRFNGLTGDLVATIADPSPDGTDNFGWSIGVVGNTITVGAPLRSISQYGGFAYQAGAVFIFDANSHYSGLITGTPFDNQERFGMVIGGSGSDLILGNQTGDGYHVQDAGLVWVYSVPEPMSMTLCMFVPLGIFVRRRRPTSENRK